MPPLPSFGHGGFRNDLFDRGAIALRSRELFETSSQGLQHWFGDVLAICHIISLSRELRSLCHRPSWQVDEPSPSRP